MFDPNFVVSVVNEEYVCEEDMRRKASVGSRFVDVFEKDDRQAVIDALARAEDGGMEQLDRVGVLGLAGIRPERLSPKCSLEYNLFFLKQTRASSPPQVGGRGAQQGLFHQGPRRAALAFFQRQSALGQQPPTRGDGLLERRVHRVGHNGLPGRLGRRRGGDLQAAWLRQHDPPRAPQVSHKGRENAGHVDRFERQLQTGWLVQPHGVAPGTAPVAR